MVSWFEDNICIQDRLGFITIINDDLEIQSIISTKCPSLLQVKIRKCLLLCGGYNKGSVFLWHWKDKKILDEYDTNKFRDVKGLITEIYFGKHFCCTSNESGWIDLFEITKKKIIVLGKLLIKGVCLTSVNLDETENSGVCTTTGVKMACFRVNKCKRVSALTITFENFFQANCQGQDKILTCQHVRFFFVICWNQSLKLFSWKQKENILTISQNVKLADVSLSSDSTELAIGLVNGVIQLYKFSFTS